MCCRVAHDLLPHLEHILLLLHLAGTPLTWPSFFSAFSLPRKFNQLFINNEREMHILHHFSVTSEVTDDVTYTERAHCIESEHRAERRSQCVQKKSGGEVDCPRDVGCQSIFFSRQRISEGPFQCTLYIFIPPVDGCEERMEGGTKGT